MALISDITLALRDVEIVCYVVYVRITDKVTRLFVTDFTHNRLLNTQNSFECKFDDKVLHGDLILQVTLFKEQYDLLIRNFYSTTKQHLLEPDSYSEQFVKEKLCLLKLELKIKNYRNSIDAVAKRITVLHQDRSESSFYNRMFDELPDSYVRENWQTIKNRVDDQYLPNCEIPPTLAADWTKDEDEDEEPSIKLEPTPRTLKEIDNDIIPDTLFPDDYSDAQWSQRRDLSSDSQNLGFYSMESEHGEISKRYGSPKDKRSKRKGESQDTTSNLSTQCSTKRRTFTPQGTHTLKNALVYKVNCRLLGTIPELSRVCSKSYVVESGEITLSDPKFRDLTLLFADVSSNNLVEVVIGEKQMESFFGGALVEMVYTKIEQMLSQLAEHIKSRTNTEIEIKKSENPAGLALPQVWTFVDTKLADIISPKR